MFQLHTHAALRHRVCAHATHLTVELGQKGARCLCGQAEDADGRTGHEIRTSVLHHRSTAAVERGLLALQAADDDGDASRP